MALVAPVEHGKVVETESQSSLKNKSAEQSGMDKDAFLQLLVAQMKYQDPLQPTSNTEYISQYAQFSQVEQIQNMAASSDLARATQLVGKEVYIKTTTSSGDTKYVQGRVDYVVYEGGKAYLSIDEQLYALEDLDTVVDQTYLDAYNKAYDFTVGLNKLPAVGGLDMSDAKALEALREIYDGMSDYEKGFVAQETRDRYEQYMEKLKEIYRAAGLDEFGKELPPEEKDPQTGDGTEVPGESGGTEESGGAGETQSGGGAGQDGSDGEQESKKAGGTEDVGA